MESQLNGKAVIFDLDGVLVDTGEFHKQSWYDLARVEGFNLTDEFFYQTFGMRNGQIIPLLLGDEISLEEVERLSLRKEQIFRALIAGKMKLLEGVRSLLEDLKKHKFRLAVGSSAPKINLDFMLKEAGITDCFDSTVNGQDVVCGKPAPDTFLKAAEKISVPPNRCVVIEDAVQGVEAGKAAGMAVVAVTTTRRREELHKAEMVVDSLAELNAGNFEKLIETNRI